MVTLLGGGSIKIYFKWAVIAIAVVIAYGGVLFGVIKVFSFNEKSVEVTSTTAQFKDNPTKEQLAVINVDFNSEDKINQSEISSEADIYNTIHQMANTKIIAEDGQIWGLKAMTKTRVENVQNAVKDLGIEDERIIQMLDRWTKQDFSQCVEEHNYIWSKYLRGTIGKAVKLR